MYGGLYILFHSCPCLYYTAGSDSTTNAMATIDTSIPFTSVGTGSGSTFGDTTSRTDSTTIPPVTETPEQSKF